MPSHSYSPQLANRHANVALPAKCECARCHKFKLCSTVNFSNKQLEELRRSLSRREKPHVICVLCTPRQATDLECTGCDIVKRIDQFSKIQRRDRDNARCNECMKHYQETKIHDKPREAEEQEEKDDEEDYDSESSDDSNPFTTDGTSVGGVDVGIENMSISGTTNVSSLDTRYTEQPRPSSWKGSSTGAKPFSVNAYRSPASNSTFSQRGLTTRAGTLPSSVSSPSPVVGRGGWAKPFKPVVASPAPSEDEDAVARGRVHNVDESYDSDDSYEV